MRRRILSTMLAVLTGAAVLALAPAATGQSPPPAPSSSPSSGRTGTALRVTGSGCFLPDSTVGADGLMVQLVTPGGTAAAAGTITVERDGTYDATWSVPSGVPAGRYLVQGTCIAPEYPTLGVTRLGTFTVTGEGPAAIEREPATPRFPEQIEPYPTYEGQTTCSPNPKPGMVAFRDMIMDAYPGTVSYGISRDCSIGGTSEHKEGRAWDWANDANDPADARRVSNLMRWLFRTDQYGHRHAMARRLGIMYIIWNRRIFRMYRANEGWSPYSGSSPHTDHVHFSLTWRGARQQTSFWTMQLPGPGGGGGGGGGGNPPPPPTPDPPAPRGPRAAFEQSERPVDGTFEWPVSGDFDGDRHTDILWFGQGANPEYIWWGRAGRSFANDEIRAAGRLRPVVGDFNGDHRSDILWYGSGNRADKLWFGKADRTWRKTNIEVNESFPSSLVGDFDGDGNDDVFWYGPGSRPDRIWWGRDDHRFSAQEMTITGTYRPVAADFDGDGRDDVFWYGPGSAPDHLWYGKGDRTFAATDRSMPHDQTPLVGDFNGNGNDDVFFYSPGAGKDRIWWGRRDRTFAAGAVDNVQGTYSPFTGDLDDDGVTDIFWYRPGTGADVVWWFQPTG